MYIIFHIYSIEVINNFVQNITEEYYTYVYILYHLHANH